ncbi:hypothetical protein Glove_21g148 [Diversispora epigaea]|uniref:Uncharacterized protein n=1 Tax=Diversispora epigaea TaxID=1348612 RepID=A0A397JLS0_9GLOM|nr:hypothetical protein Glove_21g148 [Diversispora epigaea]
MGKTNRNTISDQYLLLKKIDDMNYTLQILSSTIIRNNSSTMQNISNNFKGNDEFKKKYNELLGMLGGIINIINMNK